MRASGKRGLGPTRGIEQLALVGLWVLMSCGRPAGDASKDSGGSGDTALSGEPGLFRLTFAHAGADRRSIVYVPEAADAGAPLMINLHGFGGTAESQLQWADMRDLADRDGTIVVYPQGTELDGSSHWNSSLPSEDNKSDAEDFGFIEVLIDTVAASYDVDQGRVYVVGYSNGGMMSFGLACFRSDRVAGVGSVSGAMLDDAASACEITHPTSVITLHGTADSVLPYDGGEGMMSAEEVVQSWVERNEASEEAATGEDSSGGATIQHRAHEDGLGGAAVHHYRYVGGGHVWFEETYEGADASTLLWDFLHRFDQDGER